MSCVRGGGGGWGMEEVPERTAPVRMAVAWRMEEDIVWDE
jgi:hypothetical protein